MQNTIELAKEFAKNEYAQHDQVHQWDHVEEVMDVALKLAKSHPEVDLEVLQLAVIFHDINYENYETHVEKSIDVAEAFLNKHNYPRKRTQKVLDAILAHSGPHRRKLGDTNLLEGQILYDADKFGLAKSPGGFKKYESRFYFKETKEMLKRL